MIFSERSLTGANQALWALLIVVIPVLGALAFIIVKPGENDQT
jgi:Phospholipase_D-nuclease N-terminal